MRAAILLTTFLFAALISGTSPAFDKNGVAPQAISLPSGPGSIQGLGESFQPQLNTGSGSTGVKLLLPRGPGGMTPEISLAYNSGGGNGVLGLGWSLSGVPAIRRNTDRGVPLYVDGPNGLDDDLDGHLDNPEELDTYTGLSGEELVPLVDGSFRAENEEGFFRYARSGEGWEARGRDGRRYLFGLSAASRIEDSGRVFEWCLERMADSNGNAIDYEYLSDGGSPAQKYLRRVRWGSSEAYLAAVLSYEEGRPDVTTSYRACFEVRTRLRLVGIDVISHGIASPAGALRVDLDGDGLADSLVRRYRLEYEPGMHLSLLARVTQLGYDGVTALPTLSYTYTSWTPPDSVSASVIRSRGAPAEGFDSPSVELIDMNGDGLPDLLSTAGNQHRVALNRGIDAEGRLAWAPGRPVGNAPTIDISSDRAHLADATADGLSDLLVKVTNTSFFCFDNTSKVAWTGSPFPIRNTDTWPIWPYDGAGGAMSRSFDSDYSRSNDVLHTSQSGGQLWLLLPGGRYSREVRLPPLVCDGKVFRFDLPGTHIADLNGDRLQDLAWIQPSRVDYFPSRGRGDFAAPVTLNLGRTLSAAEIERADFSDIDGDGLVDLTVVRPASLPNGVLYWLNRFERGFDGPRSVLGLPAQRTGDALRWADLNGNGTTDIVISQAQAPAGEKILVVDLVPEGKPFLLRQADNGLGLRIRMDYESSTAQMVRAETAGQAWTSVMPVAITVVMKITEDDGLSPPYEQAITYRDPYYDPVKQEFRGFAGAQTREAGDASAAAKVGRFVFDTGREEPCLKGKPLSEEVLGEDGKVFARSTTAWRTRVLAGGLDGRRVCYAFGEAVEQFVHEGEPVGIRIRSETDYDDYGNAIFERRLGVVDKSGDEIVTERTFELRLSDWRLDLLSREATRDGSGKLVAERRSFYDARGNLERLDLWLEGENRFIVGLGQRFDGFGNVIEKTDARGSRRSIAIDPILHAWPTAETVHLGDRDLGMTAEYDLGLGVVTASENFAGERSEYRHDALGRLVERQSPGGAAETYEYQLGAPVNRVVKRGRESARGATLDAYVFSDGRGRELLTKLEAEGGKWRVASAKGYNARKLESRNWLAYLSDTADFEVPDPALPHNASLYDALGRVVETLSPDGSRTRSVHRPLQVEQFDGEDLAKGGNPDVRRSDGLNRLVEVEERSGAEAYRTRYTWNARGELESIVDALGNVKRFRFDTLSRLVEVDDPDRGLLRTVYDDVGNPIERVDAKGQVIGFSYDAANRPIEKVYRGAGTAGADLMETRRHYDLPAGVLDFGDGTSGSARNTTGRPAWVEDLSGETHFSYDERGNVEWVLKRLRDGVTGLLVPYRTRRQYDLLNREVAVIFPDNDLLRFEYGQGSFVTRIRGDGLGARTIVESAEYNASGQPLSLLWGNGVESRFEYDSSQRLRAERLLAPGGTPDGSTELRHEELAYDLASNLVAIDDLRPVSFIPVSSPRRTTARFAFDELHRLVRASYGADGSAGVIDYEHDALGNLLKQSTPAVGQPGHIADPAVELGVVSYQGGRSDRGGRRPGDPPGPHALSGTASGHGFKYDSNGNVTVHDAAQLSWDFEDRLVRHEGPGSASDYVYDHSGRRVIRRVARGGVKEEIWHIDAAAEVSHGGTAGVLTKYAFLDGRRVARVQGLLDPDREAVQSFRLVSGWNLVSAAVETQVSLSGAFGSDAAIYESKGGSNFAPIALAAAVPMGRALWVHVPTARVVALRGRPEASDGEQVSSGPLHAWPRLEAFRPGEDLEGEPAVMVYDAATRRWLRRRDPSLPKFLSSAPDELGSAQGFWSPREVRMKPAEATSRAAIHHQTDAVGSVAAMTDSSGALIEERSHYPFGGLRSLHRPGSGLGGTDYDFTGHERDKESGLVHMGARSYLDQAGVFLSPDPRFVAVSALAMGSEADKKSFASYLTNPQMGNLYAHALRNPLRYIDPEGLEVSISPSLGADGDFKLGWQAFTASSTGRALLANIESRGGKIYIQGGDVVVRTKEGMIPFPATTSRLDFNSESSMGSVTIDMNVHRAQSHLWGSPGRTINRIAKDIFRDLRRAQIAMNLSDLESEREKLADGISIFRGVKQYDRLSEELTRDLARVEMRISDQGKYFFQPSKDPAAKTFANELEAPLKAR